MSKTKEVAFEYAKYSTGEVLHITLAQSGANGYYCLGCNSAMIAYFGKRQPHFKHHPNDVDKSQECTWSDETYRHKIAKEILQRLKAIKVPKVSIAVPKEFGGGSVTIAPSKVVRASSVVIERYIYEDELGQVKIGKNFDDKGGTRHLLVKPDVLFLDEGNKPILIIELCATHRTDEEKRMKLMHLGVDAIELLIPKAANPEEIEKNIVSSNYSKWLYCNEQTTTKFNPATHKINNSSSRALGEPGEIPKGETIQCRTFRVRECIRGVKKFMGGSDFAEARRELEESISRVERNAERVREELAERSTGARAEAEKTVSQLFEREQQKIKELEPAEASLAKETEAEEADYRGLEKRYQKERDRLINQQRELERQEDEYLDRLEGRRKELVTRIAELKECRANIEAVREREEQLKAERARIVNLEGKLREDEQRTMGEEARTREYIEQEKRLREREAEEAERKATELRRMEEDIVAMEREQSRVRKSREKLARIKDRAIDARFDNRE